MTNLKKISFLLLVMTVLVADYSYAKLSTYIVDGKFEAVFPSQPQLIGELGKGEYRMRGFNANDESNFIVYTAGYQIQRTVIKELSVDQAINDYIKGQALIVDGTITHRSIEKLDNEIGGYFIIDYVYSGMPIKKHGAVIYYDGRFYHWAVQEIQNVSKVNGLSIFKEYVKNFRIIKQKNHETLQQNPPKESSEGSKKEWIPITSGPLGAVFIDLNSVKKIGNLYQVDSAVFYYDAQLIGTLKYKKGISTSRINCQEGTTSSVTTKVFSDEKNIISMDTDKVFRKPTGPNTQSEIDFICNSKLPCEKTLKDDDRIEIIRLAGTTGYMVRNLKKKPSKIYSTHKEKPPCRESKQCDKVEGVVNRMVACNIKDNYITNYLLTLEKSWNLCDFKYSNQCKYLGFSFWP